MIALDQLLVDNLLWVPLIIVLVKVLAKFWLFS
ncbi:MAG: hypothetical protein RJB50_963 [Actinomycetota bacterium]